MSKFNFNPPNHFIPSRVNVAPGSLWSAGSEADYTIKHNRGLGVFFIFYYYFWPFDEQKWIKAGVFLPNLQKELIKKKIIVLVIYSGKPY